MPHLQVSMHEMLCTTETPCLPVQFEYTSSIDMLAMRHDHSMQTGSCLLLVQESKVAFKRRKPICSATLHGSGRLANKD